MEEKTASKRTQVLVVGGGPGGMTMAHELHRFGIATRVIDKHTEPELSKMLEHTRAVSIFPITGDVFQEMGVWPEMSANHYPIDKVRVFYNGCQDQHAVLTVVPTDIPSQYLPTKARTLGFSLSQNDITTILEKKLADQGLKTELGVELVDFIESADGVDVTLHHRSSEEGGEPRKELLRVDYLIAADGHRSPIREKLGIQYEGFTYESDYGMLDAERPQWTLGRSHDYCFYVHPQGFTCMDTPQQDNRTRMVVIRNGNKIKQTPEELTTTVPQCFKAVGMVAEPPFEKPSGIKTQTVFKVHNRCANRWVSGKKRIYLIGDAAHNNTPAFGQGMNMAIQDAFNLSWKLSLVLHKHAQPQILDTYRPERVKMWKHASLTSKMVEDSMPMSRHLLTRSIIKNVTKWKRARSTFVQFGTGYKASCSTPLSDTHRAPRGSVPVGFRVPASNINYKPGLHLTLVMPTALASHVSDPGAELQRNVYKPAEENLVEQLWTAFLARQWRLSPTNTGPFHSLYIFDTTNQSSEVARVCAEKYPSLMRVYHVVSSNAPADTVRKITPTSSAGFGLLVDGDDGLSTLLGMQRGGVVLVRPDEYVAFVSNELTPKQLQTNSGAFCNYLKRFYC